MCMLCVYGVLVWLRAPLQAWMGTIQGSSGLEVARAETTTRSRRGGLLLPGAAAMAAQQQPVADPEAWHTVSSALGLSSAAMEAAARHIGLGAGASASSTPPQQAQQQAGAGGDATTPPRSASEEQRQPNSSTSSASNKPRTRGVGFAPVPHRRPRTASSASAHSVARSVHSVHSDDDPLATGGQVDDGGYHSSSSSSGSMDNDVGRPPALSILDHAVSPADWQDKVRCGGASAAHRHWWLTDQHAWGGVPLDSVRVPRADQHGRQPRRVSPAAYARPPVRVRIRLRCYGWLRAALTGCGCGSLGIRWVAACVCTRVNEPGTRLTQTKPALPNELRSWKLRCPRTNGDSTRLLSTVHPAGNDLQPPVCSSLACC